MFIFIVVIIIFFIVLKGYPSSSENKVDISRNLKNNPGSTRFFLRRNNSEEIDQIIRNMTLDDKIFIKRGRDVTVNIFDSDDRLLGSIPKEISTFIAKNMDLGIKYDANIIGAFGKNGLEIMIWPNNKHNESNSVLIENKQQESKIENNCEKTSSSSNENNELEYEVSKKEKNKAFQTSPNDLANNIRIPKNGKLVLSQISIGENTILTTFNNSLLKIPYQIKMEINEAKNPGIGNYWDYSLVEVNTGLGRTVSQEEILNAIAKFGRDYVKMGVSLFDKPGFSPNDMGNFINFSTRNMEYYIEFFIDSGILEPTSEQVLQATMCEIMTVMAESIARFIEERFRQFYEEKAKMVKN